MNFKRFISGVSAFAVASSVFAGLAVTASAEMSTLYTQDFENLDGNVEGWTTDVADRYPLSIRNDADTEGINNYLAAMHVDQNNGVTITSPSYASYTTAGVKYSVSMDIKLGGCDPHSRYQEDELRKSVFSINTSSGYLLQLAGDTPDPWDQTPYWVINENSAMTIDLPGTQNCNVNPITDNSSHPWYHIEVTYDNDTQKEYLTITDKATGAYAKLTDGATEVNNLEIPVKMSNTQVSNITYDTNRYWAGFAMDNLKIDAEATHNLGYTFTSSIDEAKTKNLVIIGQNAEGTESQPVNISVAEKLGTVVSGEGSAVFSVFIKGIPNEITIKSISLE